MKHSTRKNRWLPMVLILATLLTLLLVACTEGGSGETAPADTVGVTSPSADESTHEPGTVGSPSEEATEAPTEEATPAVTEAPTEEVTTEDPATRINEPTDPAHVTFYDSKRPKLNAIFSGANQCRFSIEMDPTYGSVVKLITTKEALPHLQSQYQISNIASHAQGLCVRILSPTSVPGSREVSPTLEDVYLHYFGEEEDHDIT